MVQSERCAGSILALPPAWCFSERLPVASKSLHQIFFGRLFLMPTSLLFCVNLFEDETVPYTYRKQSKPCVNLV
jgi:hypothetical protein